MIETHTLTHTHTHTQHYASGNSPKHFFMFNGLHSGLLLYSAPVRLTEIPEGDVIGATPSLPADVFHSKAGFTVSCWFCVTDQGGGHSFATTVLSSSSPPNSANSTSHGKTAHGASGQALPHVLFSLEGHSVGGNNNNNSSSNDDGDATTFLGLDAYLDSELFLHLFVMTKAPRPTHAQVCWRHMLSRFLSGVTLLSETDSVSVSLSLPLPDLFYCVLGLYCCVYLHLSLSSALPPSPFRSIPQRHLRRPRLKRAAAEAAWNLYPYQQRNINTSVVFKPARWYQLAISFSPDQVTHFFH